MSSYFGNMFAGVGEQMPGQGGNYLNPGHRYVAHVDNVIMKVSQKGGHQQLIVEMRILESNDPARPIGCAASWVLNTNHQPWKGNYTWFLAACAGIHISDEANVKKVITPQVAEFAVVQNPVSPLKGRIVAVQCETITTQGKKQPFTKHMWEPVDQAQWQPRAAQVLSAAPTPIPGQAPGATAYPSGAGNSPQHPPAGFNLPQPTAGAPSAPNPFGAPQAAPNPFVAQPPAATAGFPGAPPAAAWGTAPPGQPPQPAANPFGAGAMPFAAAPPAPPTAAPAAPGPSDWRPNPNDPTGRWEWSPSTGQQRQRAA